MVVPRTLLELSRSAGTIVRGQVVSTRVEPHPDYRNIPTLLITLKVEEVLKGKAGQTFTFRQAILDIRDRYDHNGYKKGQHVLLLLARPSRYGFSSPMGLEQGRFRLVRSASGRLEAVNGFANRALFDEMPRQLRWQGIDLSGPSQRLVETHRDGPIAYDALRTLIREMAGAEQR